MRLSFSCLDKDFCLHSSYIGKQLQRPQPNFRIYAADAYSANGSENWPWLGHRRVSMFIFVYLQYIALVSRTDVCPSRGTMKGKLGINDTTK